MIICSLLHGYRTHQCSSFKLRNTRQQPAGRGARSLDIDDFWDTSNDVDPVNYINMSGGPFWDPSRQRCYLLCPSYEGSHFSDGDVFADFAGRTNDGRTDERTVGPRGSGERNKRFAQKSPAALLQSVIPISGKIHFPEKSVRSVTLNTLSTSFTLSNKRSCVIVPKRLKP